MASTTASKTDSRPRDTSNNKIVAVSHCYLKPVAAASFLLILCLPIVCVLAASMDTVLGSRTPYGPRIEIKPNVPVIFFEAGSVSNKVLTCTSLGDRPDMFSQPRWSGPNRKDNWLELSKRHRISEQSWNGHSTELEFTNPSVDDSGVYHCQATYQSSDEFESNITVRVYNPIKLDNCPERQFVVEGSVGQKITCHITGDSPRVVFWKDNTLIEKSDSRYKWDNEDGLVIEGPADKTDAGIYRIQVTGDDTGERKNQVIRVEVHSRPQILPYNGSESEPEFSGVEGDQAELKCEVTGNPRPIVHWRDPRLRNLTSVGGYFVNPERGTLIISKVNRVDDHGEFQCNAHNNVGETSRKVSMAVYLRPNIVAFENKTADEGSEVTFECRASGDPKPNISIRKHGLNQTAYRLGDGLVRDSSLEPEGGGSNVWVYRLTLLATKASFGVHYCNASNRAGFGPERLGLLSVNYKPDLSLTPAEQFVKLGKKFVITCHIRAYPEPQVSWLSDNLPILNVESSTKTSPDGQTHIVTMSPPGELQSNFHRFVCQARNKMGHSEQIIIPRYTTQPGLVVADILERGATMVKLQLSVPNDGGDRIKSFRYKLEGKTLDIHNPIYTYRPDYHNETYMDASLNPLVPYTIRNLLPFYTYSLTIRAVNDVGPGDEQVIRFQTTQATRPEPPVIIRPGTSQQQTVSGFISEYSNGYLLKWAPPDNDNGDPITKYVIKFVKVDAGATSHSYNMDEGQVRIIEQMSERPMHARIGPLERNRHYRIEIQARNKYGDSDASHIVIVTSADRPVMPEFDAIVLPWLTEPSTPMLLTLLILGVVLLITIDIMFCLCFQIGVSYTIRNWCCPSKANSVISDKTYT